VLAHDQIAGGANFQGPAGSRKLNPARTTLSLIVAVSVAKPPTIAMGALAVVLLKSINRYSAFADNHRRGPSRKRTPASSRRITPASRSPMSISKRSPAGGRLHASSPATRRGGSPLTSPSCPTSLPEHLRPKNTLMMNGCSSQLSRTHVMRVATSNGRAAP
jgi:hypothetical protein